MHAYMQLLKNDMIYTKKQAKIKEIFNRRQKTE